MTAQELFNKIKNISMFTGVYDAKLGNREFMYGIWTVMEFIAKELDEQDEFNEIFVNNLLESEKKVVGNE